MLSDLPAVDELANVPAFEDLRPSEAQREAFLTAREQVASRMGRNYADALDLGCVVRLDRGFPLVACEGRSFRAEHAVGFAKGVAAETGLMPTVGDWVAVALPPEHDMGVIEEVLPRRSAFVRWRGGRRGEFQTLAANLDAVVVVAALGEGEVPLDRIARSLVLVRDCGAVPAVVLTKADRKQSDDALEADVARVRRLAGEDARVVVTSSAEGVGIDAVRALVPERSVAMILGESGAGKSTLLNALLGQDALATGAVRLGVARTRIVRLVNGCDARGRDEARLMRAAQGFEFAREIRVLDGGGEATELLASGHAPELAASGDGFAESLATGLAQLLKELGRLPDNEGALKALEGKRRQRGFLGRRREVT